MAFDAGSIVATLELDRNPFNVGLDEARADAQRFRDENLRPSLGLDSTVFRTELDRAKAMLDEFSKKAANAKLELNIDQFKAKIDEAKAMLDEFSRRAARATARVEVDSTAFNILLLDLLEFERRDWVTRVRVDTAGAAAEIARLKAELDALHDRTIVVRVRRDGNAAAAGDAAAANAAGGGGSNTANKTSGVIAIIIALLPVVAAALSAVIGLVGALTVAVGFAAIGFGALAIVALPALKQISLATKNGVVDLNKLPPSLQNAGIAAQGLQNELKKIRDLNGNAVGAAIAAGFNLITAVLESTKPLIIATTIAFEKAAIVAQGFFQSPMWRDFVSFLSGQMSPIMTRLTQIFFSLIAGVLSLSEAFYKLGGSKILDMIVGGLQEFAKWSQTIGENATFRTFVDGMVKSLPPFMNLLGSLGTLLINLIIALTPLGDIVMVVITKMADAFNMLPPSLLAPIALGIAAIVMAALGINPLLALAVAVAGVGAALVTLYNTSQPVRDFVDNLGKLIQQYVVPAWNNMLDTFKKMAPVFQPIVDIFVKYVLPILANLADVIVKDVIPAIIKVLPFIGEILGAIGPPVLVAFAAGIATLTLALQAASALVSVIADVVTGNWSQIPGDLDKYSKDITSTFDNTFGPDTKAKIDQWFVDTFGNQGSIMNAINGFWGEVGKWIDSIFGNQGVIMTSINNFWGSVGKLIDSIFGNKGTIMTALNNFWGTVGKWIDDTFGNKGSIMNGINGFEADVDKKMVDIFGNDGAIMKPIKDLEKTVGKWFDDIFGNKGVIMNAINSFFADRAAESSTRWNDFLVSPAKKALDGLGGFFKDTFGNNGTIMNAINGFLGIVGTWANHVFGNDGVILHPVNQFVGDTNKKVDNTFGNNGTIMTALNGFFGAIGKWAVDTFGNNSPVVKGLDNFFKTIGKWFLDTFGNNGVVMNFLNAFFTDIGAWFVRTFGNNSPLVTGLDNFFNTVRKWFSDTFGNNGVVMNFLNGFFRSIGQWFVNTFGNNSPLVQGFNGFFRSVGQWFSDTFGNNGTVMNFINGFGRTIGGFFAGLWRDLGNNINTFIQTTVDSLHKIGNAFAVPINWVITYPINDGIIGAFNTVMGWLGQPDRLGPVGPIPYFAAGGEIPMVAGAQQGVDSVLIKAMPGEFVLSLQDVANLGGTQGVEALRHSMRGYADGGPIVPGNGLGRNSNPSPNPTPWGNPGNLVDNIAKPALDAMIGVATNLIHSVMNVNGAPGTKNSVDLGLGLVEKLGDGAINAVTGKIQAAISAAAAAAAALANIIGGSIGGGAAQWAGLVGQVLGELGQPQSLIPGVIRRINFESGGNPTAINLTDSNAQAGHPSQGLMQTIPSTFYAYAGPYAGAGIDDPHANIYAGLNYALHTYGSIAAIDPLNRPMGYDTGGWMNEGMTLAINSSGQKEAVLTGEEAKNLKHGLGNMSGLAKEIAKELKPSVTVNMGAVYNPVAETDTESALRRVRNLAAFGLFGTAGVH